MTNIVSENNECCPKFDPTPWDGKMITWSNKKFVKDHVFTLFYMPVNFGSAITRLNAKAQKASAISPDWLCLSDHTSMWNMDIYLAVDKDIPDAQNVSMSGSFFSKVYEGDFKETGKWCKDFESAMKERNLKMKKMYMWYTTCPKCAKKFGKNYVVIFGQVE